MPNTYFTATMNSEDKPKEIVLIRLSSMGDVVLALSLVDTFSRCCPGCRITFVVCEPWAELLRNDSRIHQVLVYRPDLGRTLATQKWDRIVDLQNNRKSRALTKNLHSKEPIGRLDKMHRERALLLLLRINRYPSDSHIIQRYHKAAGLPPDCRPGHPEVITGKADSTWATLVHGAFFNSGRPVLACFPFAAWINKEWPLERFAACTKVMVGQGWRVAVFGGPQDKINSQQLCDMIGQEHTLCLAGITTLGQTAALIRNCRVALGNDTGLSHLARACGLPTAMIFGATSKQLGFFPVDLPRFKVFEIALWCRPCHAHGGKHCWRGGRPCLTRIDPQLVAQGVLELAQGNDVGAGGA